MAGAHGPAGAGAGDMPRRTAAPLMGTVLAGGMAGWGHKPGCDDKYAIAAT